MTIVVGVDGSGRTHRLGALAAAATAPVVHLDGAAPDLADRLAAARDAGAVVVVDDAHRLTDQALTALAEAARGGVRMMISRRPTVDRPALAALDEAVAGQGPVEVLRPLDERGVAAVMAAVTGRPASLSDVEKIRRDTAGLPAVVAAVAASRAGDPAGGGTATVAASPAGDAPPALVARVQQRLARFPAATATLARILALGLDLADDVLAAAAGTTPAELEDAMRELRDSGMLVPGEERMVPAVARAVLADLPPTGRRRLHDRVASALVDAGAHPVVAAEQLRAARARTPTSAVAYLAAAEHLRFSDPEAAVGWYGEALESGADPAAVAPGRAEASALLGVPSDPTEVGVTGPDAVRLRAVAGATAAHDGRADRAVEEFSGVPDTGALLSVPYLVVLGRMDQARAAAGADGPLALRRFAEAALAAPDPPAAVPRFIEAAEALEAQPPQLVLPDTAHAVGALVAVAAGDVPTAEHLLHRALAAGTGGPVATGRHRLLLAWVHLRSGRYDTPAAEVRRLRDARLPGRDRLVLAALVAGLARRSGDVARLREAWRLAEPMLARRTVDLLHAEPTEELLVAGARLHQHQRLAPVLDRLDAIVADLGSPPAWAAVTAWTRLQVAVATDDATAAATAAARLTTLGTSPDLPRQEVLRDAATAWAAALAGDVDAAAVLAAAERLAAAHLPWEASRLAGDAAIRTPDPATARRLLERARELAGAGGGDGPAGGRGGLSDREVEVARLVLAGRTHREIGEQLYLSPKTVEHHVARIRTKLGATTRAELLAALREILDDAT
ncbi:MAG: helix-turn-helix transcriptional regulator [Micromonosporaceae bacterium]